MNWLMMNEQEERSRSNRVISSSQQKEYSSCSSSKPLLSRHHHYQHGEKVRKQRQRKEKEDAAEHELEPLQPHHRYQQQSQEQQQNEKTIPPPYHTYIDIVEEDESEEEEEEQQEEAGPGSPPSSTLSSLAGPSTPPPSSGAYIPLLPTFNASYQKNSRTRRENRQSSSISSSFPFSFRRTARSDDSSGKKSFPLPPSIAKRRPLLPLWETRAIRFCQIFSIIAGFVYLAFRWYYAFQYHTVLGHIFVLTETILICLVHPIGIIILWHPLRRDLIDLDDLLPRRDFPSVDVMIPCYSEPLEIIQETARAAVHLDYPSDKLNVYVLDDGAKPEVKRMVDELNARKEGAQATYIARKKTPGVPHHAKAGNMNHAILTPNLTKGEYILVLDCDMVPLPYFLTHTLGHFYAKNTTSNRSKTKYIPDPSVALVQTPQDFYNVPEDDPLGQRYLFFYDYMLPGWEGHNTIPCCGTNVIFRRSALESINGFATLSITEDVLTSMRLNAKGYRSAYVNERLAFGLVPTDIQSFTKQRERWALGSLQIMFREPPFLKRGLTFIQRLLYTWLMGQYLLCIPYLLTCFLPIVYLLKPGLILLKADVFTFLAFFLPYIIPIHLTGLLTSRDVGPLYWLRGQQDTAYNLPINLQAIFLVLTGIKVGFTVTRKDGAITPLAHNLPFIVPHLTYWLIAFIAVGKLMIEVARGTRSTGVEDWISYSMALSAIAATCLHLYPPISFFLSSISSHKKQVEKAADILHHHHPTYLPTYLPTSPPRPPYPSNNSNKKPVAQATDFLHHHHQQQHQQDVEELGAAPTFEHFMARQRNRARKGHPLPGYSMDRLGQTSLLRQGKPTTAPATYLSTCLPPPPPLLHSFSSSTTSTCSSSGSYSSTTSSSSSSEAEAAALLPTNKEKKEKVEFSYLLSNQEKKGKTKTFKRDNHQNEKENNTRACHQNNKQKDKQPSRPIDSFQALEEGTINGRETGPFSSAATPFEDYDTIFETTEKGDGQETAAKEMMVMNTMLPTSTTTTSSSIKQMKTKTSLVVHHQ